MKAMNNAVSVISVEREQMNPFPVNHEICIFLSVAEGVDEDTAEALEALTEGATTFTGASFQEAREKARDYIADEAENLGFCAVLSETSEAVDVYDVLDGRFLGEFYGFDAP